MIATFATLLLLVGTTAALKAPASSKYELSRRRFAMSALAAFPVLLDADSANADFKAPTVELSDERKAQLRSQGGPQLGGDGAAFRIECARDDQECLDKKRAAGIKFNLGGTVSKEERRAAIQKQASACRAFCGREDLKIKCEAGDEECLAKKKALLEEGGVLKPAELLPYIGGLAAFTAFRIATAPEKTSDPKGMKIREDFYAKRKKDTDEALASGKRIVAGRIIDEATPDEKAAAKEEVAAAVEQQETADEDIKP